MRKFVEIYNGSSLVMDGPMLIVDMELYTDASGIHVFRVFFHGQFFAGEWLADWRKVGFCSNLMLYGLFPIIATTEIW